MAQLAHGQEGEHLLSHWLFFFTFNELMMEATAFTHTFIGAFTNALGPSEREDLFCVSGVY